MRKVIAHELGQAAIGDSRRKKTVLLGALNKKQWRQAVDYLGQLVTEVPPEMIGLLHRRYRAALAMKELDLAREDLDAMSQILGEEQFWSLVYTHNVAFILNHEGRTSEAATLMEKLVPLLRKHFQSNHKDLLPTLLETASNIYESNGEPDKAESLLKHAEKNLWRGNWSTNPELKLRFSLRIKRVDLLILVAPCSRKRSGSKRNLFCESV